MSKQLATFASPPKTKPAPAQTNGLVVDVEEWFRYVFGHIMNYKRRPLWLFETTWPTQKFIHECHPDL